MMTHHVFTGKMLTQSAVEAEFDSQAEEFRLLDVLLQERQKVGLTRAASTGTERGTTVDDRRNTGS